ncbi:DUF4158 domain-containing protein [Actinomadura soli]|uniref:DUF4158 domain-containing protein n=1 Tax=Actinomadura soli TaxID=2508997 RepID=UPI001485E334
MTVRWLGVFLEDPLDVPAAVLDFVSEQLGIVDPSQVKRYSERAKTKLPYGEQTLEIRRLLPQGQVASPETDDGEGGDACARPCWTWCGTSWTNRRRGNARWSTIWRG